MDAALVSVAVVAVSSIGAVIYLSIKLHDQTLDCARLRVIEARLEDAVQRLRADLRAQEIRANEAVASEAIAISESMALVDRLPHSDRRNVLLKTWEERASRAADRDKARTVPERAASGTIGRLVISPMVRAAEAMRSAHERAVGSDGNVSGEGGDLDRGMGSVRS